MEKFRCFICIDFPDEVVKEVARVQEILQKTNFSGKLTELENLHLTLKFLGEIEENKVELVKERLRKTKFFEMELSLGEVGVFSFNRSPRIVWSKVNGKGIFELQKEIDNSLNDLFSKEERFMSHLTIARIKYVKDKIGFNNYVKNIKIKKIKFKISDFKLKKSELKSPWPVYRDLEEFRANL